MGELTNQNPQIGLKMGGGQGEGLTGVMESWGEDKGCRFQGSGVKRNGDIKHFLTNISSYVILYDDLHVIILS
jgi:hypothetical protein